MATARGLAIHLPEQTAAAPALPPLVTVHQESVAETDDVPPVGRVLAVGRGRATIGAC
jgi:hypothetical protein